MLTGKERINRICNRQEVDRCGFWLGHPHKDALENYKKFFNVNSENELAVKLNSDLMWISGENGLIKPLSLYKGAQENTFINAETVEDIEKIDWNRRRTYMFLTMHKKIKFAIDNNLAVFSGMASYFWHKLLECFGMEECFVKMYTHPEVVEATVNKIVDIYLVANKALYNKYSEHIDAVFFFNDLGTQLDTLVSPELFRQFFLPGAKKLIEQAKSYKLKVALHSCGSIERFIPDIINAGVDILHPIQANARNMEATHLQEKYGNDIIFMGGLDTQNILPFGTTEEVITETKRLKNIFGKHFILSPSHEALLANVSGENVLSMADEATKIEK